MNNNKIIGARGERLLRLTSAKGRQIKNADSFSVCYGGAEGNVLRSLSCLGRKTRFLSKMGKDESVSLENIEKICKYLECNIEQVVEIS